MRLFDNNRFRSISATYILSMVLPEVFEHATVHALAWPSIHNLAAVVSYFRCKQGGHITTARTDLLFGEPPSQWYS